MVGNRFQERDDSLRLEEFQRIIQCVAGRNHLLPGGEFPGKHFALPQKAADLDPEEPFVVPTPEVEHAGSSGFRRQQRERKRQRNLLRNRERTREMQQLLSVRHSDALRRKVDAPQDEPRAIAIRNRSRQREQLPERGRKLNFDRVLGNILQLRPFKRLSRDLNLAAPRGTDQLP